MRLTTLLASAVLLACGPVLTACGPTETTTRAFDTSGDCAAEESLVRRSLDRSALRVDVDGDGRLDEVAVATDHDAGKRCRAFVGVRLADGSTHSTHLHPAAVPPIEGLQARIVGLPDLGDTPGAQIVVDTRAAVDSVLAQLFTLTGNGLRRVHVPVFEDGTFIVEGGGVVYPYGAACTADGRMVLSTAEQSDDGERFRVTRRTYEVRGPRVRFADPEVEESTVPLNELDDRFPEFAGQHWRACTGEVRR